MAIQTIPARTVVTCDRCGVVKNGKNDKQEASLLLKSHALDMHGHACADASRRIDLCDSCLYVLSNAIDAAMKKDS